MEKSSKIPKNSQEPLVSVNLVVYNGEKYIRQCLDSVLTQTYRDFELNILDNNSSDNTVALIETFLGERGFFKKDFLSRNFLNQDFLNSSTKTETKTDLIFLPPHPIDISIYQYGGEKGKEGNLVKLVKRGKNLGMWPGQEELLKYSRGKYIVALSVDVILDENFVAEAVKVFEQDEKIGAVQGKIYKFKLPQLETRNWKLETNIIDTCGFRIFRSRRVINIGHGEIDRGQYDKEAPYFFNKIFAVEGAVPVLRRQALEDCRLKSQDDKIIDPDFFWYSDDLDIGWRMRLFGWKEVLAPKVIAWHDRQTTKSLAGGSWREFIKIRKRIPMFKRRLDWRNTTLAIIKNDFAINFLRDLPFIFWRQLRLWFYFILFEPRMILEIFNIAKLLPKMLKRRYEVMKRAKVSAREIRKWFS
jgi:hypothetical protein